MILYCYSTYKYSPVGFAIGAIKFPIKSDSQFVYLKGCSNTFVKKCFESSSIRKVYGKNPQNGRFYFLAKNLKCDFINDDNVSAHKKGNFMFEFDSSEKNEYVCFCSNYNKKKLEQSMDGFLIPDSLVDKYALKIDAEKLNEYIISLLSSTDNNKKFECDDLYFETITNEPDTIRELSGITGCPIFVADKSNPNGTERFTTKKKSAVSTIRKIAVEVITTLSEMILSLFSKVKVWVKKLKLKCSKK